VIDIDNDPLYTAALMRWYDTIRSRTISMKCQQGGLTMPLNYRIGDATQPYGVGNKVLVHVCNDVGAWGKGFVLAISKRWKEPEKQYRQWSKGDIDMPFQLGNVGYVQVEADLWV